MAQSVALDAWVIVRYQVKLKSVRGKVAMMLL